MPETSGALRVNLHCHSTLSDGVLSPEELAERLAQAGVQVAALTDHDTVEGQVRFREALARRGVGWIAGLELSVSSEAGALHLLAYGFDPQAPSIEAACRRAQRLPGGDALPVREALTLLHEGRARVFLAHPLEFERDPERLRERLRELKALGLDGLEANYLPYAVEEREFLAALAEELGLAVSFGTDFHDPAVPKLSGLTIGVPEAEWRRFARLLITGASPALSLPAEGTVPPRKPLRFDWRDFSLRIAAPSLLALVVLLVPLFVFLVPGFEEALLSRKREMIRELTRSACSVLQEFQDDVKAGRLSPEQARSLAAERIRHLRYGREGKDYFWITDLQPRMVMHPYRPDLDGQDLSAFRDPKGNRLFVESVNLVKAQGEGYQEYLWQWKDEPGRVSPKQSYVRRFEPWGWIVGTGIYLDDVKAEIDALTRKLIQASLGIFLLVALCLLLIGQQSYRLERRRWEAEEALRESHERYRALAEASREGTLILVQGRAVFANATFLDLSGHGAGELALLDAEDLLDFPDGRSALAWIQDPQAEAPCEARLRHRDGGRLEVLLNREPVRIGEREGLILLVRDLRAQKEVVAALGESQARFRSMAENLRVGVFRAELAPGWPLMEANGSALALFGLTDPQGAFAEALADPLELEAVQSDLLAHGEVRERVLHLSDRLGGRAIALSATLVGEGEGPRFLDAIAEDVTARERTLWERETLIAELQAALMHLSEPVERLMGPVQQIELGASVREAAQRLSRLNAEALVVVGAGGEALGMVGDRELRARVLATGLSGERPIFEVMSSPLPSVEPLTPGFEALSRMRELDQPHLVVKGADGRVLGLVRGQDLVQPDALPMAQLLRALNQAADPREVAAQRSRLPLLVKGLLDSGVRPRQIGRAVARVADAVTGRLLELAEAELPSPGAPYAWLVLGSEGREEQTLHSDQDSALIFPGEGAAAPYLALGSRVQGWLEAAGYPACSGGMMASNPRWCQSLEAWKRQFSAWVRGAESEHLLEFSTFFDFRCVAGDAGLAQTLRAHVLAEVKAHPAFLGHLAREMTSYRVKASRLDLKALQAPLVAFARLYALKHGIPETSTFERLRRIHELGVLSRAGFEEANQALELLLTLRLRHQGQRLSEGLPPDNLPDPRSLTQMEERQLRQVQEQITVLQKKVGYEFLGGVG